MPAEPQNLLHLRCGQDILQNLKDAGLPGRFLSYSDPLCEGPTPNVPEPAEWYRIRSAFLAQVNSDGTNAVDVEQDLRNEDAALGSFREHDAVVLWFEHDLYDQAVLIRLLAYFASVDLGGVPVYMVTTDRFPGVQRFIGLGNLNEDQLASLYPGKRQLSADEISFGARVWNAYCSPDPTDLQAVLGEVPPGLPYLAAAMRRHLEEFPSTTNGVGKADLGILRAIAEGAETRASLFTAWQAAENAPWLGDTNLFYRADTLGSADTPLLRRENGRYRLTDKGSRVLRNEEDWGIEAGRLRWVGGVHSAGPRQWRWNPESGSLVLFG